MHTNRNLQGLRERGLVAFNRSRLSIPDFAALQQFSLFDPRYLGLARADGTGGNGADERDTMGLRFLTDREPKAQPSG